MKYAVIVTGKQMPAQSGGVMAVEGEKFWARLEPDGWVEATSAYLSQYPQPPHDLKTFDTKEAAEKFGKRWKGHPWWCSPKSFEVVEVEQKFKQIHDGWKVIRG